jgi:hypothetical protein
MFARVAAVSFFAASLAIGCAAQSGHEEDEAVSNDEAAASSSLPAPGDTAGRLYYGTQEFAYLTEEEHLSSWVFSAKGKNEFKTSVAAYGDDGVTIDTTKAVGFKLYGLSRTWGGRLVWSLVANVDGNGTAVKTYTGSVDRTYLLTAAAGQFPTGVQIGLSCKGGTENCALRQQPTQACSSGKLKCDTGLFCSYAAPSCGTGPATGTCTKPPQFCTRIYAPVCGCDGKTYGNQCEADAASVSIKKTGACATCDASKYTNFDPSMTHMAETTWMNETQSWFYDFKVDGTFTSMFAPPCLRTEPRCAVRQELRTGKFFIVGSTVSLQYADGQTGKFTAQWNCEETKRFVGIDHGDARTLTASTVRF